VWVRDGDHVQAGQLLVELDPTMASADKASVYEQYLAAHSEVLRTQALLVSLDRFTQPSLRWTDADRTNTDGGWRNQTQAQLHAEWNDIYAKRSKFEAEIARRRAEIKTAQETLTKLQTTLPIAQLREQDYQTLVGQGFMSGHATQDRTRERIELERDLATQSARLLEAQAALRESIQAQAAFWAETRRPLHDRQFLALSKRGQLHAEGTKAGQREQLTQLKAPVAGVVQQLAIHSVGGVVTSAQPLMVIVPDSEEVTAIVQVANQDIGFVRAGHSAEIKLETFPYTQYGTVPGTVSVLGGDAITDEKTGISTYPAILTLHQRVLRVDGKSVAISPGMNLTAEIKTGQRRIIQYLLSPIQRARQESLRER
jgi:hemolysin D